MHRTPPRPLLFIALALCGLACGHEISAQPPRGPTPYPHDMGMIPGRTHVANPDVPTTREYWRIYRDPDGAHFFYPDPAGDPILAAECRRGGALGDFLRAENQCERSDHFPVYLSRDAAMRVSTHLHRSLRFTARGDDVVPPPLQSQLELVCDPATARDPALAPVCRQVRGPVGRRGLLPIRYDEAQARALAARLNQNFGIR